MLLLQKQMFTAMSVALKKAKPTYEFISVIENLYSLLVWQKVFLLG